VTRFYVLAPTVRTPNTKGTEVEVLEIKRIVEAVELKERK